MIGVVYPDDLCYSTLQGFANGLVKGFIESGYEAELVMDTSLKELQKEREALIFFNSALTNIVFPDGSYVMDSIPAQIINMIVDAPATHHPCLLPELKNYSLICLDENHVHYVQKYYPHIRKVIFGFLSGPEPKQLRPFQEREIEVLFTGSYEEGEKVLAEIEKDFIRKIVTYVIKGFLSDSSLTTEELVKRYFEEMSYQINNKEFANLMWAVCWAAERYMRCYYRDMIIGTLANNGIKVSVYGDGWENFHCLHEENIIRGGHVSYEESVELTANAKICLNIMPWFKAGIHDRVLTAMKCKAVCLTDSSSFLDEHFINGKELVLYSLGDLEKLAGQVSYILSHEQEAMAIAEAGFQKAQKEFSWRKMAQKIIDAVN